MGSGLRKGCLVLCSERSGLSDSSLNVEHVLFKFLTQLQKCICILVLVSKFLLDDDSSSAGENGTQEHIHTYSCMHSHACTHMHTHLHMLTHVHTHMHTLIHACTTHICTHAHTLAYTHTHTHSHAHTYTH